MSAGDHKEVVLINPRATYVNEIAQKVYPPLNLLYLGSALRESGHSVAIVEANAFRMTDEQITEAIRAASPLLVGIGVYTEILPQVRGLAKLAKDASTCKVVLGGAHASAIPEKTLTDIPNADFLLRGEAERTLPALTRALSDGTAPDNIPGLWYRRNGKVLASETPPAQLDIASIPTPARDLVAEAYESKRYYSILIRSRPIDTIITSRGCPFSCHFCYNLNPSYRGRSAEDVVAELVAIRRGGIRDVEIVDDNFTMNRERAMKIFDLIIREGLGISFRLKSRVNVVDEELLTRARQAGAYQVSYGTESGVQDILDAMDKRITVEQMVNAIELTKRCRLNCHTSWICGYPGETPETFETTVDLIVNLKPTTANIDILIPYPQTQVYLEARDAGTLVGDWGRDLDEIPWVRLPWTDTRSDLENIHRKAMRRIYYRPYYVGTFGSMMIRNANWTLGRYAWQELRRTLGIGHAAPEHW